MLNVHASGGRRMMEAAREGLERGAHRPLLIAVTILTSLGAEDLAEIGLPGTPEQNVLRLATLAQAAGLDGIVCSPQELPAVRQALGRDFLTVTPGVRPPWAAAGDQKRVMTPAEAIAAGSDFLVVGRPITAAADPIDRLRAIRDEIGG
jgi:orotidine-5'-phosphate decarboxylase